MPRTVLFVLLVMLPVALTPPLNASASDELREFQQAAAELIEANGIPGAGIALVKDGDVAWAGGIGYADLAAGRPVLATTLFRIGSVTKMFTALAVLQLVERGRLSLDMPVHDIAPDVPIDNPWRETDPVRVAHLLEHTAGFDDMHFHNMNTDKPVPDSLAPVVAGLQHELTVRWRPGVKHSYSNAGYAVAAYLVEIVTGMPFHEYVRTRLLEPLQLESTGWGMPAGESLAQGYTGDERRPVVPRAIHLYPAGELSATSQDMARLVRFFLQGGALDGMHIDPALIDRMETPRTTRAARHGLETGYGLGNVTLFRKGFRLQGHDGGLDGFSAEIAYSREHDFGYAILLNRSNGGALHLLGDLAVDFLARDIEPPEPENVTSPVLPAIAGCYRMTNPRNELLHGLEWLLQVACVKVDGERALMKHPVLPDVTAFLPAGGDRLRESWRSWPAAVFMQDAGRSDAIEWRGIYFERSNLAAVTLPLVLAILALALMVSAIVFFPVWIVRWKFGALKHAPAISARAWPLIASLLFFATLWWATRLELSLLDSVNAITLGIFVGGIAFMLASFYAVYRIIETWNAGVHPVAKWHSLLVGVACAGVTLYLVYWRLVPLRVWAW